MKCVILQCGLEMRNVQWQIKAVDGTGGVIQGTYDFYWYLESLHVFEYFFRHIGISDDQVKYSHSLNAMSYALFRV